MTQDSASVALRAAAPLPTIPGAAPTPSRASGTEAENVRLREALQEIRDRDWVENVLDPQWAPERAARALSLPPAVPVVDEHDGGYSAR